MPSASQPSLTFLAKSSCIQFSLVLGRIDQGLLSGRCMGSLIGCERSTWPVRVSLRVPTFPPHRRYAYLCLVKVVLR